MDSCRYFDGGVCFYRNNIGEVGSDFCKNSCPRKGIKLEEIYYENSTSVLHKFCCPGCNQEHFIKVVGNDCWEWNGDPYKPTINPSIRVMGYRDGFDFVCHSFIRDGKIQFLGDCTHNLKNKTIDLPDMS